MWARAAQSAIAVVGVGIVPDADARELLGQYRHTTDVRLGDKPHGAMWARAAQNAIAVAGVIALGVWAERNYRSKAYPDHPIIEKTHAELAITLVDWSVGRWLYKLGTELADTPFDALLKKALRYIANARDYRSDKRFGQHCGRGLMPRGKLTKLMKEEPRIVDSVIKSLVESEQIVETVEEASGNKVRLYHATNS